MLRFFNTRWDEVPIVSVDTETTGLRIGHDRACSAAVVRFEQGVVVASLESLIDPGIPIPEESTAIHGISGEQVKGSPRISDWFSAAPVVELLRGAQPSAFNAEFDRQFVPAFADPWNWPWLDGLTLVRKHDRFTPGAGRHKLAATCARHGIVLEKAHSAEADARAAGHLLLKLGRKMFPAGYTLGQALGWQLRMEAVEWQRFHGFLAGLPPREEEARS